MTNRGPHIVTITGGIWYPFDPRVEDVRLEDVRGLAFQSRFMGHAGVGYSPIQHMSLVADWLEEQGADGATVREGLGHDMHEAWPPGDVPAPCKRGDHPAAIALRAWEEEVERVVRTAFRLPLETSAAVRLADLTLLATEKRDLNPGWANVEWGHRLEPWGRRIVPVDPARAWAEWLAKWRAFS